MASAEPQSLRVLWSNPLELSELPLRRLRPSTGAVYVLWRRARQDDASFRALYVGYAYDVQRRLLDHLSGAYARSSLGSLEDTDTWFQVAPLEPADARRDVACFLFEELRPHANRRSPGGRPRAVNLPGPPGSRRR